MSRPQAYSQGKCLHFWGPSIKLFTLNLSHLLSKSENFHTRLERIWSKIHPKTYPIVPQKNEVSCEGKGAREVKSMVDATPSDEYVKLKGVMLWNIRYVFWIFFARNLNFHYGDFPR